MAANRKLPFGYTMRAGHVVLHPAEAETVRWLYLQYAGGRSYESLTRELRQRPVPYLPGKLWNKNMVARILADERYLGTEQFPQVVGPELYRTVRESVLSRAPARRKSESAESIRRLAVCAACGGRACRDPCRHGKERWYCPSCGAISTRATDQRLESGAGELLARLIRSPQTVLPGPEQPVESATQRTAKEAAFQTLLDTPDFDEALAKQMALDLAAARFDALGPGDYETTRIQYILRNADAGDIAGLRLLREIAGAVLIHPDGKIGLRLKNGQIIEEA